MFEQSSEGGLEDTAGLIIPGFRVEVDNPAGPTTFFAVRNTTDESRQVDIAYYGKQLAEPLRTDMFEIGPQETLPVDVRSNLNNLEVDAGFATGFITITESGVTTAENFEGDFFRVDFANDFATGDRLLRPADFCNQQEIRFVDFGSGSRFRIILNDPPTGATAFNYTAFDQAGNLLVEATFQTEDHFLDLDVSELVSGENFGTVLFDFTDSGGGWVSAEYSAFGRFSVELNSACRDMP